VAAQGLAVLESVDRPLAPENSDELAPVLETGASCQIRLVEVDFIDRAFPASAGAAAGPAFRYLRGYRNYGVLDGPQRTLAAAKRSVEAAINEYLRANFTAR
jgi:hypothetical protein